MTDSNAYPEPTEPPEPPALWPRREPAPERVEYEGTLRQGAMHETAIRATALTAAVASLPDLEADRPYAIADLNQRTRYALTLADTFARYITTGERPE